MNHAAYFWKRTPFLRILLPFIAGIFIQWHCQFLLQSLWISMIVSCIFLALLLRLSFFQRFKFAWLQGLFLTAVLVIAGAILTWFKDTRHQPGWFGTHYREYTSVLLSIDEPPVEKAKSFKANARVRHIMQPGVSTPASGKIILYFRKDTLFRPPGYGSIIILTKPLQEIKNSGNPAGFDYKRYCFFGGITHQVYLRKGEFEVIKGNHSNFVTSSLFSIRDKVINILRKYIPGTRQVGLAEALLIGYKNDLDKSLVQSYSNTGVVHVIAISGLHIGLIYWLLLHLLKPLVRIKHARWLQPVLIITGLWIFSLLAGGQPSVLRSALMFTCIVAGQHFSKKTSIYNTLAFSAFLLLCYNPYWLWDVGFQLSYSAVLSILIFMKPIYNWFYIKNKILDFFWKLNAITLAAQILTLPISIYHFHQFPGYFLLANFIVVPLSSLVLLGEILLCIVSFIPFIAVYTGKILSWLITLMNNYVEVIEELPYSLIDNIQVHIIQVIFIFLVISATSFWLMEKAKHGLILAIGSLMAFFFARSYAILIADRQKMIIVYNIPGYRAIDFIDGRKFRFYQDSALAVDDFIQNFHLKPARTAFRVEPASAINQLIIDGHLVNYSGVRIMLADTAMKFSMPTRKHIIDLLIISKNPRLYMARLVNAFEIKQVVFDGSASFWKLPYWKKDCDSLGIPWYDVNEKGAFVMNLN